MFIRDLRRTTALSISFWLTNLGILVMIWPEAKFYWTGVDSDPVLFWWLGIGLLIASNFGRIYKQGLSPWREWFRIAGIAVLVVILAFLAAGRLHAAPAYDPVRAEDTLRVAVPFIAQEEGERRKAYLDIVGVPTICFGSTRGVRLGMIKTHAECLDLLRVEVAEYRDRLHRYFNLTTRLQRLTPERDAAYTSTAFNCGVGAIGKSTATRRLNAGDIAGGCEALGWWNRAGGRVIRGLVLRRQREQALCLQGLK